MYSRYFKDFLAFLVLAGLSLPQVSTVDLLAFLEHLYRTGMSFSRGNQNKSPKLGIIDIYSTIHNF